MSAAEAIARLREELSVMQAHKYKRSVVEVDDLRVLLDAHGALEARVVEFERLQQAWLTSPEAAKRLDGYRELTAKCAALEAAYAEALDALERFQARTKSMCFGGADFRLARENAVVVLAKAGRR